ncbi:MAG: hypothetical protein ACTHLK_22455 [Brucella intermedia]
MASELKPCPFCGGTDLSSGGDDKFVGYSCKTCQATGPNHYGSRDWNTPPTPLAPVSPDEVKPFRMSDGVMPIIVMARTREEAVKILNNRVNPSTEPEPENTSVSPDATGKCGGLVTVDDLWDELVNYDDRTSPAEYPDMALITKDELADFVDRSRSQFEELLAAERAEKDFLIDGINVAIADLDELLEKHHDHEGDTPQSASLRRISHHLMGTTTDNNGDAMMSRITDLKNQLAIKTEQCRYLADKLAALTARVKELEKEVAEAARRGEDQWAGWVKEEALRKALEADNAAKDAQLERFRSDRAYTVGFTDGHDAAEAKLAAAEKVLVAAIELDEAISNDFNIYGAQQKLHAALGGKP